MSDIKLFQLNNGQVTEAEWGSLLGDDVLATALLDRLLHHAEIISINGRSYRMRHRMLADQPTDKRADIRNHSQNKGNETSGAN